MWSGRSEVVIMLVDEKLEPVAAKTTMKGGAD